MNRDEGDSLDFYLKKLNYSLLSHEEEMGLMQGIERSQQQRFRTLYSITSISLPFLQNIAEELKVKYADLSNVKEGPGIDDYFALGVKDNKGRLKKTLQLEEELADFAAGAEDLIVQAPEAPSSKTVSGNNLIDENCPLLHWKLRDEYLSSLAGLVREEINGKRTEVERKKEQANFADESAEYTIQSLVREYEQATKIFYRLRNKMIQANLRIVVHIAKNYRRGDYLLKDLIQEGNIGLMKAVEQFDWQRGHRFSTYAGWWIRHRIHYAIRKGRMVPLPVREWEHLITITKTERELTKKYKRQPTIEEIAEVLPFPPEKIRRLQQEAWADYLSWDAPTKETQNHAANGGTKSNDVRAFGETLVDETDLTGEKKENFEEQYQQLELNFNLRRAQAHLDQRERYILSRRVYCNDDDVSTLTVLGRELRVSRQRVSQLEQQALKKLRQGKNARVLEEFLKS